MGTIERKERERAELKELILLKAKEILLKFGHEGLSIRKIATEIEYSPATIYLYFKDKDDILHELMEIGFKKLGEYMKDVFKEEDPIKRIYLTGKSYIKFGLENKDWYDLMFNSDKPMKHIERCGTDWDEGMRMFEFLAHNCELAIQKAEIKDLEPRILALQLWSCVHGLVHLAQSERLEIVERNNTNTLISKALDSMLISIFHQPL